MIRKTCLFIAIAAALSGTGMASPAFDRELTKSTNKTAASTKDAKSGNHKTKTVVLCVANQVAFGPSRAPYKDIADVAANPDPSIAFDHGNYQYNFYGEVFKCDDVQGGKDEFEKVTAIEGAKKLGDLAFNCNWPAMKSKTGTNIGPPFDIKLAPCNGLLTIATSWNKQKRGQTGGTDYSTAAIAFWADTDAMANMEVDGPIGGIVTGTNGAWPKPESVKDYTWSMAGSKLEFTINYKKNGWNPAA